MSLRNTILENQPAPTFTMPDVSGAQVSLADNPDSFILLAFLRYAGCPWCNLAVHALTLEKETLAARNCQIIAFIQSTKENIVSHIYDRHPAQPTFPIIADPDGTVYGQYGVGPSFKALLWMAGHMGSWREATSDQGFSPGTVDGNLFLIPGAFLISPGQRTVTRAMYGIDIADHNSFTELYSALDAAGKPESAQTQ